MIVFLGWLMGYSPEEKVVPKKSPAEIAEMAEMLEHSKKISAFSAISAGLISSGHKFISKPPTKPPPGHEASRFH